MAEFKTPGVYIKEISTLPASVVPVATAIPAFVGYTAKAEKNGIPIPTNKPNRISSYLEFQEIFGDAFSEKYEITINADGTFSIPALSNPSPYLMTYQVYMYFNNGGGPCWIVSTGTYDTDPDSNSIDVNELISGIRALEEEDEPTLLLVPESVILGATDRKSLHDQMLAHCAKLQDRFAIFDALLDTGISVAENGNQFRAEVGSSNLSYGAAYFPSLRTILYRNFKENELTIIDNRTGPGLGPFHGLTLAEIGAGQKFATGTIRITDFDVIDGDSFEIGGDTYLEGSEFNKDTSNITTAGSLTTAINTPPKARYGATREGGSNLITVTAKIEGEAGGDLTLVYTDNAGGGATVSGSGTLTWVAPDKALYNAIMADLKSRLVDLYPSASMAGVFARVDSQRGVWKAPANEEIRSISRPALAVSSEEQGLLNVDATSGKSINVIRFFQGRGNLVWGARTLAGNDNEWRYIPVRRLYLFVEESIKKATEFVVFEPNDANTWLRVKTMCENFLSSIWREGALAGAKPEQAFFVNVGLGKTMTALDILEGRMNVEIGLAAVRPAEFIILKFSHKLQES
ncbi:hypothetical protein Aoki45_23130 [Algoriphagus sp. oki45]|uniref:phage tail sheath family protein n=1 Tax=Algoriphagus sp. oki45 TaxID=3067294 RepID=UPI0027EF7478|nr:hypothetical protein Aoki45_23130 [Algoriphagus sp. oki45]